VAQAVAIPPDDAVEEEASSLPISGINGSIAVG
jgi:hypothetical protein